MDADQPPRRASIPADEPFISDVADILRSHGFRQGHGDFAALWSRKHPWNAPGPLYVGDDDLCMTGPDAAPNNVIVLETTDEYAFLGESPRPSGGEFLFRQPSTLFELRQVIRAAETNAVREYAFDGDDHWTGHLVAQWWEAMHPLQIHAERAVAVWHDRTRAGRRPVEPVPSASLRRWLDYLADGMERYLQRYAEHLRTISR